MIEMTGCGHSQFSLRPKQRNHRRLPTLIKMLRLNEALYEPFFVLIYFLYFEDCHRLLLQFG
jgi:hypothetical protein